MTVAFVPYEPVHYAWLMRRPCSRFFGRGFEPEYADALAKAGESWSAFVGGEIIGCAGLAQIWHGRAIGWAVLADETGPHMTAITRKVRCVLQAARYRRIEATVATGFPAGHRWARLLGLHCETPEPMRAWSPEGDDMYLYALVR